MRGPSGVVAVATAALVLGASAPGASAGVTLPTPLPTVSVPLPIETSTPLPPPPSAPETTVPLPDPSRSGGGTGGGGDSGGSGGGGGGTSSDSGASTSATEPAAGSLLGGSVTDPGSLTRAQRERLRQARNATPLVAGTARARGLLDPESSPQMAAASRDFLSADQAIAEIARQKRVLADLEDRATRSAQLYRALGYDILTAQSRSRDLHDRESALQQALVQAARDAYAGGQPTDAPETVDGLVREFARVSDGGARGELRVGVLTERRAQVRRSFEALAERHAEAKARLQGANRLLSALAQDRSTALQAVQAAQASDLAQHQERLAESSALGAQIQAASDALARSGRTVTGTGDFLRPLAGGVTSPFGLRVHPILGYEKLHTGLDLAGGSSIAAADDGRVLMTVSSPAYGLFTVIDHGVIDGVRVTTAYAHQSRVLVREGQAVKQGDPIGLVGSTGYSTGPHLHFEVRENGVPVDPARWLR